jgi:hypothetical protein
VDDWRRRLIEYLQDLKGTIDKKFNGGHLSLF